MVRKVNRHYFLLSAISYIQVNKCTGFLTNETELHVSLFPWDQEDVSGAAIRS